MTTETVEQRLHRICCSARDTYFNEEQAGKLPNLALIIRDAVLDYASAWQAGQTEAVAWRIREKFKYGAKWGYLESQPPSGPHVEIQALYRVAKQGPFEELYRSEVELHAETLRIGLEPKGCPTPGACSCPIPPAVPADMVLVPVRLLYDIISNAATGYPDWTTIDDRIRAAIAEAEKEMK